MENKTNTEQIKGLVLKEERVEDPDMINEFSLVMKECPECGGTDFEWGQIQTCFKCGWHVSDYQLLKMVEDGLIFCYELTKEDKKKKAEFFEMTKEDENYDKFNDLYLKYLKSKIKENGK